MKRFAGSLALCLILAAFTLPASAATILIEGSGISGTPNPEDGVFLNDEFTFSIAINRSVQPSDTPVNSFADFEDAILSFQVDGIEFITFPNFVIFGNVIGEFLTIANLGESVAFSQSVQIGTFGTGPFSLDQLLDLELDSFTAPPNLRAGTAGDGGGDVTSLSISLVAVPLPAGIWLLIGALGVVGAACRRQSSSAPQGAGRIDPCLP